MKRHLLPIKFGGSVITDKKERYTLRSSTINSLIEELKQSRTVFQDHIIVGHGSGSFAHVPAYKYKTKEGLVSGNSLLGMAVVEDAARGLNKIIIERMLSRKIPAFSFSPASFLISNNRRVGKIYLEPVICALKIGVIPVVYGDVIIDTKIGCTIFSTEKIFSVLVKVLSRDYKIKLVYCVDTDGVYNRNGRTIAEINQKTFSNFKHSILMAKTVDVTGGMLHKVEESLVLAKKYGIKTLIINGRKKGELKKAISGNISNATVISYKR